MILTNHIPIYTEIFSMPGFLTDPVLTFGFQDVIFHERVKNELREKREKKEGLTLYARFREALHKLTGKEFYDFHVPWQFMEKDLHLILKNFELRDIRCLDLFDKRADLVHDMNLPVPKTHTEKYSTLIDIGSLEHVFDTRQCLHNLFRLLKVGGRLMLHTPCSGYFDHGFYTFSPETIIASLTGNGFVIEYLAYSLEPEGLLLDRPLPGEDVLLWCVARKLQDRKEFVVPQQEGCRAMYGLTRPLDAAPSATRRGDRQCDGPAPSPETLHGGGILSGCQTGDKRPKAVEPQKRSPTPPLAAGLASESNKDFVPCGRRFPAACCGEIQSSDAGPVSSASERPTLYLGLVEGRNYGWGVCSRHLVHELSQLTECLVLNEADGSALSQDLDGKLFQALTCVDFFPMFEKARGRENYGYTFFENELTAHSIENAKRYDLVLGGSTWCRDRMLEGGISNCGILIQGIDPGLFHPVEEQMDSERFVIFSGGKFELRKGQDLVLKACKILQDRYPDIWLVNCWVNIWPESMRLMTHSPHIRFEMGPGSWRELMQHTYALNGLDPSRVVTCDLTPAELQRELYAQTDIGVFPNRCEGGTNLVLMEYMACGKPVIASYTSGHTDIVTAENALLLRDLRNFPIVGQGGQPIARWKEPSVDELVAQIEYAYHHRTEIKKLGRKAGEDLKRFTWAQSARSLLGILNTRSDNGASKPRS